MKSSGTAPSNCAAANLGNVLDFNYSFDSDPSAGVANNGNVIAIVNNRDTNRSQSFTYDELNRIKTAQSQATSGAHCWGLQFGYDIWANLLSATVTKCSAPALSQSVATNNRLSGYSYDAAGNLLSDGSFSYTWDAESRMKSGAGVTYTYDGDGRRVQKSNGKLYWYGPGLDALLETDLAGNNADEYIFFGGKRVARRQSSGSVNYYFADHLGSSRVVASAAGAILDDSDFYPFGSERAVTSSSGNHYKFTGKERDTESGLDYFIARYYSSAQGRFTSADPIDVYFERQLEPQRLNLYAYVGNNPLIFVDPDGRDQLIYTQKSDGTVTVSSPITRLPDPQSALNSANFAPPPVGPIADGANVLVSIAKGDFTGAAVNLAAMIPIFGDAFKGGKMAGKAAGNITESATK